MENKQIDLIYRINRYFFPFMVFATYAFILLESYSYIGVLRKYILIDSRFFLVFATISGILLIGKKTNPISVLVFKINSAIFLASLILYLIMKFLESLNFNNYVFSTYHIQPPNFFYIVVFSFVLILVDMFRNKYSLKNIAIFLILPIVFMVNFVNVLDSAIGSDIFVLTHLDYSYNDKMRESWGLYYDYIKFVKENTPENASILVPPQQTPWLSTGNVGLDRYFLYPRILVNGGVDASDGLGKYDYVLLVWGEWNGADKNSYGWPREKIKTDKIIYFDPATKAVREKNENFDPMLLPTSGAWGIIKLR